MAKPFTIKETPAGMKADTSPKPNPTASQLHKQAMDQGKDVMDLIAKEGYGHDFQSDGKVDAESARPAFKHRNSWPDETKPLDPRAPTTGKPFKVSK